MVIKGKRPVCGVLYKGNRESDGTSAGFIIYQEE
jgi:hypothetical protein